MELRYSRQGNIIPDVYLGFLYARLQHLSSTVNLIFCQFCSNSKTKDWWKHFDVTTAFPSTIKGYSTLFKVSIVVGCFFFLPLEKLFCSIANIVLLYCDSMFYCFWVSSWIGKPVNLIQSSKLSCVLPSQTALVKNTHRQILSQYSLGLPKYK